MNYLFKSIRKDYQYLFPSLFLVVVFSCTDIFPLIDKLDFAYLSGAIAIQPYRAFSSHFMHANFNHLVFNLFGIVVSRYFFMQLGLQSRYFFIILISFLIPIHIALQWFIDISIFNNTTYLLIGFSGIVYGVYAFIWASSIFGKKKFLTFNVQLSRSKIVTRALSFLLCVGLIGSLLPTVSLSAHLTGFAAGLFLFLL